MKFVNIKNIALLLDTVIFVLVIKIINGYRSFTFEAIAIPVVFPIALFYLYLIHKRNQVRIAWCICITVLICLMLLFSFYPMKHVEYWTFFLFTCLYFIIIKALTLNAVSTIADKFNEKRNILLNILFSVLIIVITLPLHSNILKGYVVFTQIKDLSYIFTISMSVGFLIGAFLNPRVPKLLKTNLSFCVIFCSFLLFLMSRGKEPHLTNTSMYLLSFYWLLSVTFTSFKGAVLSIFPGYE